MELETKSGCNFSPEAVFKLILMFLCIVLFGLVSTSAIASNSLDPKRVSWKKIQFYASFIFVSARADIEWESISRQQAEERLMSIPGGLVPKTDPLLRMTLTSKSLNRNSRVQFWLDSSARALQRSQHDWGKRQRLKTYRFFKDRVQAYQTTPKEAEKQLPETSWSHKEEFNYPYAKSVNGEVITDNAGLFYIISAANLYRVGDSITVHSFAKQYINRIRLSVTRTVEIEADHILRSASGGVRFVEDLTEALEISMSVTPLGDTPEEFEFLGLKGNLKIYLDTQTRVPLQIRGEVDYLGTIGIDLSEAQLR